MDILVPAAIGLAALFGVGLVFAILYKRSTRDQAYVRTGLGGKKVVLDGGSVVLPVFHSIAWVNLNTLRLEVRRGESDALITKDRMRVDIGAEFYVRVKPDSDSIALAAQTLGERTNNAEELRQLIEAKFVDGLRSVAATMELNQLQEKRADFVKAVQEAVGADLQSNGLELESVSLTRLDQTDIRHFNPNNVFDAQGLASLTKITEDRRKERNEVVRNTEVAISQKDLEARQQTLAIERTQRESELTQERDIANIAASTRAEVAAKEQQAVRSEEEARIDRERAIAEREAEAGKARETAQIEAKLAVRQRQTGADRDIEIAKQEAAIAVAERSRAESEARAQAEDARAMAVAATEKVSTAQAVEVANRDREISIIAARKAAEVEATSVTVAAEAEKNAATDRADAIRIAATADAEAAKLRAEATVATGQAEAEAERLKNEARNVLDARVIEFELTRARIQVIPAALAEIVKPVEKISDIRIFDTGGMLGRGGDAGGGAGVGLGDGLAGQLLNYSAQRPVLDELLKAAGFAGGANPTEALLSAAAPASKPAATDTSDETRAKP
ncbi:flotillin family protein [Methylopila musalis]|uniref:Flotillin family protein n=1 Tax=Methylopila musalis TaxID=1134781 RepID=A0ABW3Z2U8_9HYPH